jgi:hypothetical protein
MKLDTSALKPHFLDYLRTLGITPNAGGYVPCPKHADSEPYKNCHVAPDGQHAKCFVCGEGWDIVGWEMVRSSSSFPVAAKAVSDIIGVGLGNTANYEAPAPSRLDKPKKAAVNLVPLPLAEAQRIFTVEKLLTKFAREHWGDRIAGMWAAKNERGEVEVVDVRFEKGVAADDVGTVGLRAAGAKDEKAGQEAQTVITKTVISFFWDGQRIQSKGCPVVLFGRDGLASEPDWPVCFHEGAKCFDAARAIHGVTPVTWNRGAENVGNFSVEPIRGRTVYIYPDDDAPGRKAARALASRLQGIAASVKICSPMVRGPGYDVVDALAEGKTPDEIRAWILEGPALEESDDEIKKDKGTSVEGSGTVPIRSSSGDNGRRGGSPPTESDLGNRAPRDGIPFRILGTADDGNTYFLNRHERLSFTRLTSLTKNFLVELAPLSWWLTEFPGGKGGFSLDEGIDMIMEFSRKPFDPDNVRGVGAWKEPDGRTCYNDGERVWGDFDERRVFLKRTRHDIGLGAGLASAAVRKEMLDAAAAMSFETQADAVRLLAWSVIAPFGGALPWRPAGYLTGESESGKTTAVNFIVKGLAGIGSKDIATGGETSGAGVRQHDKEASKPVIIEEAEDDTQKKKDNKEEILSIMRQSTSDDAPKAWKGTQDGRGGIVYDMRKTFLFVGISPLVGSDADRNRLFFVNMVPGTGDWKAIKARIRAAFTDDNCHAVQAFVWEHLREILDHVDGFTDQIEAIGALSIRYAGMEAILFSAFWRVFMDRWPEPAEFSAWLAELYRLQAPEKKRNQADEMVERILEEVVKLTDGRGETRSLGYIMRALRRGQEENPFAEGAQTGQALPMSDKRRQTFSDTALDFGLRLDVDKELAIKTDQKQIMRILGMNRGYSKILKRSPRWNKDRINVGGNWACVVMRGFLDEIDSGEAPF